MKDVHTEHCCVIHGCKYGDNCSVERGVAKQSFPCESCEMGGGKEGEAMVLIEKEWELRNPPPPRKVTQKMLAKRGIDITKHRPSLKDWSDKVFSRYDSFQKSDLDDDVLYEIEEDGLYSYYKKKETQEQLGRRLCKEHDNKKSKLEEGKIREAQDRATYEKLHKRFGNNPVG